MKKMTMRKTSVALLLALTIALVVPRVGPVVATSSTTTYVLGVSNPLDPLIVDLQSLTSQVTLLPSVSGLASVGGNSILFIDGSWLATASSLDPTVLSSVVPTVLSGVPTVVVRGNPAILENSVSGLMKFPTPNLPLISDGVQITGALADGTRQATSLKVIAGFDYAISTEFQWAQQQLARAGAPITLAPLSTSSRSSGPSIVPQDSSTAPAPSWSFVIKVTTDTGDFFKPFGRVATRFTVFRLENSGSGSFKWYNFFFNQTIQPGIQIYPGSNYRNYLEQNAVQMNNQTSNLLIAHGPAAMFNAGPSVVTYSIGTQAGVLSAAVTSNQTMTYFLKNTNVTDTSSGSVVSWVHSIDGGTSVGKLTLQIIPGWTDRVMASSPVDLQGSVTTTFATFNGGTATDTHSTYVQFSAFGG